MNILQLYVFNCKAFHIRNTPLPITICYTIKFSALQTSTTQVSDISNFCTDINAICCSQEATSNWHVSGMIV